MIGIYEPESRLAGSVMANTRLGFSYLPTLDVMSVEEFEHAPEPFLYLNLLVRACKSVREAWTPEGFFGTITVATLY